jgi:hypothetical protein
LLQRRETRPTDGFPVSRFMFFEPAVVHQKRNPTMATPRERRQRSLLAQTVDGASVTM